MRAVLLSVLTVTGLTLAGSRQTEAGFISLSLESDAPDLTALVPGQTVEFTVKLAGLDLFDELDDLAADVRFDANLFGSPSITFNSTIIPDTSSPATTIAELPGVADVSYAALFSPTLSPIIDNGVFFSFEVTVQDVGTGTVAFDRIFALSSPFSATSIAVDAPFVESIDDVTDVSSLSAVSTPEPGTCTLLGIGSALLLGFGGASRRKRRRAP